MFREPLRTAHSRFRQYNHAGFKKKRTALKLRKLHGDITSVQNELTMHFFLNVCVRIKSFKKCTGHGLVTTKSIEFFSKTTDHTVKLHIHPRYFSFFVCVCVPVTIYSRMLNVLLLLNQLQSPLSSG